MPDDAGARAIETVTSQRSWLHLSDAEEARLRDAFAAALRSHGDERTRRAWEEAFKIRCKRCDDGEPVHFDESSPYHYSGGPPAYWHLIKGGAMNGDDLIDRCDAAYLRARAEAIRARAGEKGK